MDGRRMFELSYTPRSSRRIGIGNKTKSFRQRHRVHRMRSGGQKMMSLFGTLEVVYTCDGIPRTHSLAGSLSKHRFRAHVIRGNGLSDVYNFSAGKQVFSARAIPKDASEAQYGGKTESSKLRPSIRDHREMIQDIQEKSAHELKRQSNIARNRAKMKYEQKIRRESRAQITATSDIDGTLHQSAQIDQMVNVVESANIQKNNQASETRESFGNAQKQHVETMEDTIMSPTRTRMPSRNDPVLGSSTLEKSLLGSSSMSDDESGGSFLDDLVDEEAVKKFYHNEPPRDVHVVESAAEAARVMEILMTSDMENRTFACDTEVMNIDVTRQSPCCHGTVTCFSLYCGPDIHFGSEFCGEGDTPKSMLWVDTWLDGDKGRQQEAIAILETFRPFFESSKHKKVWHNYSFDRHVLQRMGITCEGFYGDTMHMARLWDSSRTGRGGYSLEALTTEEKLMGPLDMSDARGKISMKKIFGRRNIKKDGTEGKLILLPPIEELQSSEQTRWDWINYSAYDAKATWDLHEALVLKLMEIYTTPDRDVFKAYLDSNIEIRTLWDIYSHIWRPFGNLLTDMEAFGVAVDVNHLMEAEKQATEEEAKSKAIFREWAASKVPDAKFMNVGSSSQVVQLLFGGAKNRNKDKPGVPLSRTFKVPNMLPAEEGKKAKKNMDITIHNVWSADFPTKLVPEIYTPAGLPGCSTQVLKSMAGKPGRARKALSKLSRDRKIDEEGIESVRMDFDETWSTDDAEISRLQQGMNLAKKEEPQEVLEEIAKEQGFGRLFSLFGNREEGLKACAAVDSLIDASAIDTLLSNFIVPLQSDAILKPDENGIQRVHCSLNINTETGRLSARRPNLQNQPALEKDRYKVRQAFTANKKLGNALIVADYGQLELRILAHMANCTSMIQAFELGGDFHSRTALGMYDHIKKAIDQGDCLLEWDAGEHQSEPPVPLLKDMFSAERRRAKVLNFSIAYGKTAHGLSKDWGVTLKEAEETVERWYAERSEVRAWQHEQHALALSEGYVCTILGRRRQLPDARSKNRALRSHSLRAAINTPIQGSAADVATAAMLRIDSNQKLRELGWRLLLQVHDEVILEGPRESANEAQQIVIDCMKSPFGNNCGSLPLRVELSVDSKYADTWYDAK